MYTLARTLPTRQLLVEQLPALVGAFVIAESFYKFGSFSLECLAFLSTWVVLDGLISTAASAFRRESPEA